MKTVQELIEAFRPRADYDWSEQRTAVGCCFEASTRFAEFARSMGYRARDLQLRGLRNALTIYPHCARYWQDIDGENWNHHLTQVYPNLFVDWTVRQYEPDAPFPHVYRSLVTIRQWQEIWVEETFDGGIYVPHWIMSTKKKGISKTRFAASSADS